MRKFALGILSAAAFCTAGFAASADGAVGDDFAAAMHAMFLSQAGAHKQAAAAFSELAAARQDAELMREAYLSAARARDAVAALEYARQWRQLGGGKPALQAVARVLLASARGGEATPALFELKQAGATNAEIFGLLRIARKKDSLPLARKLLDDSAAGNFYKARLAARFGEWDAAKSAAHRGLAQAEKDDAYLADLYLMRMRIAAGADDNSAAVVLPLDEYIARKCPGAADIMCREADVIYAFALFADERDWRAEAGDNADAAALAAGRFFERAGVPLRAIPHYEKLRGKLFFADLGLARIFRNAGQLADALAVLDSAPVADDREFGLRETTAAEIVRELHGTDHAIARVIRARAASPENFELMYEHSLLSEQNGDVHGAAEILTEMTALFPESAEAWNALGYVLADHTLRLDEAEEFIKKALSISPNQANILDSLGWVYYRQGRLDAALQYLARADADSDSAEIAAHLGEVHWVRGEYDEARAAFARAKTRDADNEVLNETLQRLQIIE